MPEHKISITKDKIIRYHGNFCDLDTLPPPMGKNFSAYTKACDEWCKANGCECVEEADQTDEQLLAGETPQYFCGRYTPSVPLIREPRPFGKLRRCVKCLEDEGKNNE